jgi:hypothetical protein
MKTIEISWYWKFMISDHYNNICDVLLSIT